MKLDVYITTVNGRVIAVAFCRDLIYRKVQQWCRDNLNEPRYGPVPVGHDPVTVYTHKTGCDMQWLAKALTLEDLLSLPGAVPLGDSILFTPSTD